MDALDAVAPPAIYYMNNENTLQEIAGLSDAEQLKLTVAAPLQRVQGEYQYPSPFYLTKIIHFWASLFIQLICNHDILSTNSSVVKSAILMDDEYLANLYRVMTPTY
ncbi:hypothetical protein [Leclercia sp.]|uniref:hypothetical protein n=1 Tax=Leclercia sp. TaxID=1898428 RepID=UPI0028AE8EFA|nr:hypothetical protein [Leclercia sp.]